MLENPPAMMFPLFGVAHQFNNQKSPPVEASHVLLHPPWYRWLWQRGRHPTGVPWCWVEGEITTASGFIDGEKVSAGYAFLVCSGILLDAVSGHPIGYNRGSNPDQIGCNPCSHCSSGP